MQSNTFKNYQDYLKNVNLCIIVNDPHLKNVSNIITYPNYKQYTNLVNCIPKTTETFNNNKNLSKKLNEIEKLRNIVNLLSI